MHPTDKVFHDSCRDALAQAAPAKGLATPIVYMPAHMAARPCVARVSQDSWYYYAEGRSGRRVVARGI